MNIRDNGLRIIQIQTQAEAAGAQKVSALISEGLRKKGHSVTTCFLYRRTDAYDNDAYAHMLLSKPPASILDYARIIFRLASKLRRDRPDVVISYQHYGNIVGAIAALIARVPLVIANQNGLPKRRGFRGLASLVDKAFGSIGLYDINIVNSNFTESMFAGYPTSYRRRLRKIEHGVAVLRCDIQVDEARLKFGLPLSAFVVGCVGRLSREKNHEVVVRALVRLPDVHFAIAGQGPLEEELKILAERLGVRDRLHLLGELPGAGIAYLLRAIDAFVFPSFGETFGLAAVEAAIAGVPVVAANLPVLREVLSSDESTASQALFVDPSEPSSFESAIRLLASQGRRQSSQDYGSSLEQKYSIQKMIDTYDRHLQDWFLKAS